MSSIDTLCAAISVSSRNGSFVRGDTLPGWIELGEDVVRVGMHEVEREAGERFADEHGGVLCPCRVE